MGVESDAEHAFQDSLLAQVRELTSGHGEQKALAEYLGIPPQRLSQYLQMNPIKRPNGEMTLRLQDWVTRQKKKHPKE